MKMLYILLIGIVLSVLINLNCARGYLVDNAYNRSYTIRNFTSYDATVPISTEPRPIARCNNSLWITYTNWSYSILILNSSDNGTTFTQRNNSNAGLRPTMDCYGNDIYIPFIDYGSNYLSLYRSINNGVSFIDTNIDTSVVDPVMGLDIKVINESTAFILASNTSDGLYSSNRVSVLRTDDNGTSWSKTVINTDYIIGSFSPKIIRLFFNDDKVLIFIQNTSKSFITYKSTDGGATFGSRQVAYLTPNVDQTDSIFGVNKGNNIYITGGDFGNPSDGSHICLFKSTDFGDTWETANCSNVTNARMGALDGTLSLDLINEDIYQIMEYLNGSPSTGYKFQTKLLKFNTSNGWIEYRNMTDLNLSQYYMPHSSMYINDGYFEYIAIDSLSKNLTYIGVEVGVSSVSGIEYTTFTITLPIGQNHVLFNGTLKTHSYLEPTGQTILQPMMEVTNDGNVNLNFSLNINETVPAGFDLYVNTAYDTFNPLSLTDTPYTMITELAPDDSFSLWFWTSFTNQNPQTFNRTFNLSTVKS